jgi:hypothetical protein
MVFYREAMAFFGRAGLPRHSFSDGGSLGQNVRVHLRGSAVNAIENNHTQCDV